MPASLMKVGLGWSHPSDRKRSTGMVKSILRQSGELLHKAVDIVPGQMVGGIQEIFPLEF